MSTLPTVALSLRQPWANAVTLLGKHIENRVWKTNFRGEFWIHAATTMSLTEYKDAIAFCADELGIEEPDPLTNVEFHAKMAREHLHFGGIVGRARIVSVIEPCVKPRAKHKMVSGEPPQLSLAVCTHAWHMPEQYGFVLEDIKPVPFVPVLGALQFWKVPQTVLDELARLTLE